MSEPVRGVVVAHADLAAALVRAVERIAGVEGRLQPLSNEGLGPEALRRRLASAVGEGPAIVFADLASGSCALAGRMAASGEGRCAVVTGVNLPMLLDFVFHADMDLDALLARLVHKGRTAIDGRTGAGESARAGHADHPVSR